MRFTGAPNPFGDSIDSSDITNETIVNADISPTAAIAYSKLNLAASIVNADIAAGAAIAQSKLSISIVNADVAGGAAIAYSKLNLAASIVNADIAAGAAIAQSKLAAIAFSNLPVEARTKFIGVGDFEVFGGATKAEGSATAGNSSTYISLAALDQRIKAQIQVPTGATSISAARVIKSRNSTCDLTMSVYSRSIAVGEVINGGSADSAAFTQANGGNLREDQDVLTAFDGAGIGVDGDTLAIEIRASAFTAGEVDIWGMEVVFA